MADHVAEIAYQWHLGTNDGTVGPDCVLVWRNSKLSAHKGGGGIQFFSHKNRVQGASIPTIANGRDMSAFVKVLMDVTMPQMMKQMETMQRGEKAPKFDPKEDELNRRLAQIPDKPDEALR